MIRRTRRTREIPFSFDSFLDVVANVVGIIIRLILVVWVSARSYSSIQTMLKKSVAEHPVEVSAAELHDPLEKELAQHGLELEQLQARLLEQLRDLQLTKEQEQAVQGKLGALAAQSQGLDQEKAGVKRALLEQQKGGQSAGLSLASLKQRREKLTQEIQALEKLPPLKKVLRYRTPISQPVKTDEFFFECRGGRVTFIDIASLKAMAERDVAGRVEELRSNGTLDGTTPTEGAFRIHYTLNLRRMDGLHGDLKSDLVVEPAQPIRGETPSQALLVNSQFRQVVDHINPKLAAVTFWVYPDSFGVFRQLRDFLYEREIVVAGRPLPDSMQITLSSHGGSASRGQ
jgi:hypothetical protein